MKKRMILLIAVLVLVLNATTAVFAWQGRMAGMGDPYGLVYDDSDFLIHPASIADGQGIQYFSHYRFTYNDVTDWNWGMKGDSAPWYHASGDETFHDALLGMALPAGPGRFGIFFTYDGKRGDFDGNEERWEREGVFTSFNMNSEFDDMALKLLYGLPLGDSLKLGAELQIAYHEGENETFLFQSGTEPNGDLFVWAFSNYYGGTLLPFMAPYDSDYWEIQLKTGVEGNIGPASYNVTARGGTLFASDNKWDYMGGQATLDSEGNVSGSRNYSNMENGVDGWKIGGDAWLRYPLSNALTLPFVLRADYEEKTRDGDGMEYWDEYFNGMIEPSRSFSDYYSNKNSHLKIETGGGLDYALPNGMQLAGGMYYAYVKDKADLSIDWLPVSQADHGDGYNFDGYPDTEEHRLIWRLAAEKQMSSSFTMRAGMNAFFGWVSQDYAYSYDWIPYDPTGSYSQSASLDGHHWGILGALGGTFVYKGLKFEPFVQGGYEELSVDGDGRDTDSSTPYSMEYQKNQAIISTGISVWF